MSLEDIISISENERQNLVKLTHDLEASEVRLKIFKTTIASVTDGGYTTRKIQDKIEEEISEKVGIEKKLNESKAKLSAYDDLAKIFPKQQQNVKLREGTEISKVEKFILEAGREMSLDEIVKKLMASEPDRTEEDVLKKKKSLRSTLRSYIRDLKVFAVGQGPDTFTLLASKRVDDFDPSESPAKVEELDNL